MPIATETRKLRTNRTGKRKFGRDRGNGKGKPWIRKRRAPGRKARNGAERGRISGRERKGMFSCDVGLLVLHDAAVGRDPEK